MISSDAHKPTVEELYAIAIADGTGFERLVLACGLQREVVGAMLLRLRVEYDQTRGEMERAGQISTSAARILRELQAETKLAEARAEAAGRRANAPGATPAEQDEALAEAGAHFRRAAALISRAAHLQRRTPEEVKSARAFVLLSLPSLSETKQAVGQLAVRMAGKRTKAGIGAESALRLAGRVLDVWLDETCHRCDGTGVIGSRYQGDTERQCSTCKGTGHRRDILGDSRAETQFAADLMAEVQRQVAAAAAGIRAALFNDEAPDRPMHPELARRLAELRGVEAQTD